MYNLRSVICQRIAVFVDSFATPGKQVRRDKRRNERTISRCTSKHFASNSDSYSARRSLFGVRTQFLVVSPVTPPPPRLNSVGIHIFLPYCLNKRIRILRFLRL